MFYQTFNWNIKVSCKSFYYKLNKEIQTKIQSYSILSLELLFRAFKDLGSESFNFEEASAINS